MSFEGIVQEGVHPDDVSQGYRVWKALLKADQEHRVDIRVGEWFWGGLHPGQRLKVAGSWHESAPGRGELVVDMLTDLDTNATFSRQRVNLVSEVPGVQGTVWNVTDVTFRNRQGQTDFAGYAFDLRTGHGELRAVVARGCKCEGPSLTDEREVRLSGRADTGGVIHTQRIDFVNSSGTIVVTPEAQWRGIVGSVLFEVVVAVFAVGPWVAGAALGVPAEIGPFVHALFALVSVIAVAIGVLLAVSVWRRGRRT